jgi:hypothetical protein
MISRKLTLRGLACSLMASCLLCTIAWGAPPYPPSTVITNLTWAPASSILRLSDGSDGYPITWADDGDMYTAYADGWGFPPQVPGKLSLGLAKVTGVPPNATGINIRSSTGEQTGDGHAGKKASGMLMVNGILYMWVRNANNDGTACQLAWSPDHAQTWTWASWKFNEFGYCTFLNFGQNYAGARDGYVYTYFPDSNSAYTAADRMILARVPKDSITDRNSYEFFTGLDASNNPTWSANVAQRAGVFSNPGLTLRSGMTYDAAIDRYLWWQQLPVNGSNTRFTGGFGIYDGPEPWGPWTTVYYTDLWDVGPGELANFPTKWMSADGKTLYLTFSGDDMFSVRQATLTVTSSAPKPLPPTSLTVN